MTQPKVPLAQQWTMQLSPQMNAYCTLSLICIGDMRHEYGLRPSKRRRAHEQG